MTLNNEIVWDFYEFILLSCLNCWNYFFNGSVSWKP